MKAGMAQLFLTVSVGAILLITGCSDPSSAPERPQDDEQSHQSLDGEQSEFVYLQEEELEQLLRPALLSFAADYSIDSALGAIRFQPMPQKSNAVLETGVAVQALAADDGVPAGIQILQDGQPVAVWRYSRTLNRQTILDVHFVPSNSGLRLVILSETSRFYSSGGEVLQLKPGVPNPNDLVSAGVVVTWLDLTDVRQPAQLEQLKLRGAAVNFEWREDDLYLVTAQLAWVPGLLDIDAQLAENPQALLDELRLPTALTQSDAGAAGCLSDLSLSLTIYHVLRLNGSEGQVDDQQCVHGALKNLDLSFRRADGVYRFAM